MDLLKYKSGMPLNVQGRFGAETREIIVDNIIVRDRKRDLDEKTVKDIYNSIEQHGLIQPIGIRPAMDVPGYYLVFGAHRLEAWKRRWLEGDTDDDKHKRRWMYIPSVIFQPDMSEDDMKLIELRENLERAELTSEQRKEQVAEVLELMKEKGKKTKSSFHPPSQKKVAETLNLKPTTFKSQFKAYQKHAGITANWTKLTEKQYDDFIKWNRGQLPKVEKPVPEEGEVTLEEAFAEEGKKPPKKPVEKRTEQPTVAFDQLPNEEGVDTVAEALEDFGVEPLEKGEQLPGIHQMPIVALDSKLEGLNPAQKRAVRLFIKREVESRVYSKVQEAVKKERQGLRNAIAQYGERINGKKEDIQRIRGSLHPDRLDRSRVQLVNAMQAFNRLIGE